MNVFPEFGSGVRRLPPALALIVLALSIATSRGQAQGPETQRFVVTPNSSHVGEINSLLFSGDGNQVISAGGDGVRIWEVATGRLLRQLAGRASSLTIAKDGRTLIVGGQDRNISSFDLVSGRLIGSYKVTQSAISMQAEEEVGPLARSVDESKLFAGRLNFFDIWDLRQGKVVRSIKVRPGNHKDSNVALDLLRALPDGRRILTLLNGSAKIWEEGSGRLLADQPLRRGLQHQASDLAPDGRSIAISTSEKGTEIFDLETGRVLQANPASVVQLLKFAPDGRSLLSIASARSASKITLSDPRTGTVLREADHPGLVNAAAFSPDGRFFVTGEGTALRLWRSDSGALVRTWGGREPVGLSSLASSADGRIVAVGGRDRKIKVWDIARGQLLKVLEGPSDEISSVAVSPAGDLVAATDERSIFIWDAPGGALVQRIAQDGAVSLAFESDRTLVSVGDDIRVWDAQSGVSTATYNRGSSRARLPLLAQSAPGSGSPGATIRLWGASTQRRLADDNKQTCFQELGAGVLHGERLIEICQGQPIRLRDTRSGKILQQFERRTSGQVQAAWLSVQSNALVAGGADQHITLWDASSGALRRSIAAHGGAVTSLTVVGKRILSASEDGTTRIWSLETGDLIATLIVAHNGEWLILAPEGFFASSSGGAGMLNLVRGFEAFSIDQVYDALYRPDLVREKLAGDPDGKVRDAAARLDLSQVTASGAAPKVELTSHRDGAALAAGEVTVEATVTEQGGGIGKVEWRLNRQTLAVARGLEPVAGATDSGGPSRKLSQKLTLEAGDNLIEVVAYNAKGLIASNPARITLKATGSAAATKTRLFVLSVGINQYLDNRLGLRFAVPDARAIGAAFEKAGSGLYESVKVRTILDEDVTTARLEAAFRELASEVKPSDVFLFFVAGHGRTLDGKYYFIPQDFLYRDQASYAEGAISQDQWQRWMAQVPARKSVLIYDTCESGSMTVDQLAGASRGLQRIEEQAVAYEKLREAIGRTVLAASTDTQPALEGFRGHGVMTYAVLDALERASGSGELVEVLSLLHHVDRHVPEFSKQAFKHVQRPQAKFVGSNFPIAKRTAVLGAGAPPSSGSGNSHGTQGGDVSARPTHVVIAPAIVRQSADAKAASVAQLSAGTQVVLIERAGSWVLIARDGKQLGYVEADATAALQ